MYSLYCSFLIFLAVLSLDSTKCQERSESVSDGRNVYMMEHGLENITRTQSSEHCNSIGGKILQEKNIDSALLHFQNQSSNTNNGRDLTLQFWSEKQCYGFNVFSRTLSTYRRNYCSQFSNGHMCQYSISGVYFYKSTGTELICGISQDAKKAGKGMQITWWTASGESFSKPKKCNATSDLEVRVRRYDISGQKVSCHICGDEAIMTKVEYLPTRPVNRPRMELQVISDQEKESIKFRCVVNIPFINVYTSVPNITLKINNKQYSTTSYDIVTSGVVQKNSTHVKEINGSLTMYGGQGNVTCEFGSIHKTEAFHEDIEYSENGFLVNTASGKLIKQVADIVESEESVGECEGTFLNLVVRDFTVPQNKTLAICYWSDDTNETCIYKPSQLVQDIIFTHLLPRTNYSVILSYRPSYWTRNVTLTRIFRTSVRHPKSAAIDSQTVDHNHDKGEIICSWKFQPDNITSIQQIRVLNSEDDEVESSSVTNNSIEVKLNHEQYESEDFTDFILNVIYCNGDIAITPVRCEHETKSKTVKFNKGLKIVVITVCICLVVLSIICLSIRRRKIPVIYRTTNRKKKTSDAGMLRESVFFNNTPTTAPREAESSDGLAADGGQPSTSGSELKPVSSFLYENIDRANPTFQGDNDEELYVQPNPLPEKYLTISRENDYESIKGIPKKKLRSESEEGKYENIGNVFGKEDPTASGEDKYENIGNIFEKKVTAEVSEDNYIHLDQSAPSTSAVGSSTQQADGEFVYDVVEIKERTSQSFGGEYENIGKAAMNPSKADGESVYDVVEIKERTSQNFEGFQEYP